MSMSQESGSKECSLLDTLRNFKPIQKPKLSHMPLSTNYDSSSDGSPVLRSRDVIVNLDSESDENNSDNDCVIVNDTLQKQELSFSETDKTSALNVQISNVRTVPNASTKSHFTNFNSSKESTVNVKSDNLVKELNSGDEIFRSAKRKTSDLKNKKKKRRKLIEFDNDISSGEESFKTTDFRYDSDEEAFPKKIKVRKEVIDLLNNGTEEELSMVRNMNSKKIEAIFINRPYSTWRNVVNKFDSLKSAKKGLHISTLDNICENVEAKDIVLDLMAKCEELASKTERKISNGCTLVSQSPALLNSNLKLSNYQLLGLNWLAVMRSRNLNSILADEMGLGKTIQVIAFLAYLKENDLVLPGYPHLVIVPSSTLDNWYEEFQRWCPSLNILLYHGNQDERRYLRHLWFKEGFGNADVILTTYSYATGSREEKKMFRVKEFNYVIFDEAHMLKNMNTQRYEALVQFNGNFKILLTGTPLQNNLLELMSLLLFLMPDLFRSKINQIKLLFSKCSKTVDEHISVYEKERVTQAKRIIEPFMLRRLKENVLRDLPKKTVTIEKCSLNADQMIKYNEILEDFKNDDPSEANKYMTCFMTLRKMANHPLLLRYYFTEDKLEKMAERLAVDPNYKGTTAQYIQEDLYFKSDYELYCLCQNFECLHNLEFTLATDAFLNSGKLKQLTPMLVSMKTDGHRVLIFSQFILMLDILEVYCEIHNFSFLRMDGSTQTADRQDLINKYNTDNDIFIFLLSTKAGGLGINLTAADVVVIHDIDINPYNDKQAEDRCHRVGQTRPVNVIKLISENTVEEGMHTAAMRKLHLEKEISTSNDENDDKTVVQLLKETLGLKDSV